MQSIHNVKLKYNVPISEFKIAETDTKEGMMDDLIIQGVAINSTTTGNGHKFLPKELQMSAESLNNRPLLANHENDIFQIMGTVVHASYDESSSAVKFKAKIMDSRVRQMVRDGRLKTVSIGANVREMERTKDDVLIPHGIEFKELSLVAVPADDGAQFSMALKCALDLVESNSFSFNNNKGGSLRDMTTNEELKEALPVTEAKVEVKVEETKTVESVDVKALLESFAKEMKVVIESVKDEVATIRAKMNETKTEVKTPVVEAKIESKKETKTLDLSEKVVLQDKTYSIVQGNGTLGGGSFTVVYK